MCAQALVPPYWVAVLRKLPGYEDGHPATEILRYEKSEVWCKSCAQVLLATVGAGHSTFVWPETSTNDWQVFARSAMWRPTGKVEGAHAQACR